MDFLTKLKLMLFTPKPVSKKANSMQVDRMFVRFFGANNNNTSTPKSDGFSQVILPNVPTPHPQMHKYVAQFMDGELMTVLGMSRDVKDHKELIDSYLKTMNRLVLNLNYDDFDKKAASNFYFSGFDAKSNNATLSIEHDEKSNTYHLLLTFSYAVSKEELAMHTEKVELHNNKIAG